MIKSIQNRLEDIEANLFGISDREIKINMKASKGKSKNDKLLQAKVKLFLIDPSKVVFSDKTVKHAKAVFQKKIESNQLKNLNSLISKYLVDQNDENDKQDEEGEDHDIPDAET